MLLSRPEKPDLVARELATTGAQRSFYTFVAGYIALLFLAVQLAGLNLSPYPPSPELPDSQQASDVIRLIPFASHLTVSACLLICVGWVYFFKPTHTVMFRGITLLLVFIHLILIFGDLLDSHHGATRYEYPLTAAADGAYLRIVLNHLLPALLLAWTIRDAVLPFIPIYLAEAALLVMANEQWIDADPALQTRLFHLLLMVLPGLLLCWVRQGGIGRGGRFKAYRDAYDHISQEIQDARKLHENLFPKPIDAGEVRLDYHYRPMTQLGGDYLHTYRWKADADAPEMLLCTLIDVTGHGLRATLAVNQLHALLEQQTRRDEPPDPGELMAELNRHLFLNCERMGVFATALCMRLDPVNKRVTWCSAGHPPGIVISHGTCKPTIEATAPMLGAFDPDSFDPAPQEQTLHEGAQILAYSDGATEKRLAINKMLGVQGLCMFIGRVMARDKLTCEGLMDHLSKLNSGDRDDDILLVRLGFGDGVDSKLADDGLESSTQTK